MANWYAIYTRPQCEKKVAEKLSKRKIDNYCPLAKDYRQWNDIRKANYKPLFPSYVFLRLSVDQVSSVKNIEGVINILYWLGKPAVIRDIEIEMIKRFLKEHSNVYLEKGTVNIRDIVKIINGPFMEKDGNVIAINSNKVKLILPTLGYSIMADVVKENIEIIHTTEQEKRLTNFRG
jgi:transcription antitermination factor NusG